jgi:hypothetical protein
LHCLLVRRTLEPEQSGRQCHQLWFMGLRESNCTEEERDRIGLAVMQVNRDELCPEFLDQFVHADRITIV